MSQTEIILGPPGTGKTTALLNVMQGALASGIAPEKIGFLSFTRKAVNEAKARAMAKFNMPERRFQYFRTIHSLCFYMLGLSKEQVMDAHHYSQLGNIVGYRLTGFKRDSEPSELPAGDLIVFLEAMSRLKCEPLYKTWSDSNPDLDFDTLEWYQKSLERYKKAWCVMDFTDMLTRFFEQGVTPQLDLLIIDEAQDLCLLQWRIIEKLKHSAKRTVIAGDDDQAIFGWSGAEPEYLVQMSKENPTTVLHQSYRVPAEMHDMAQAVISRVRSRVEKVYRPTPEQGEIHWLSYFEDAPLSEGEWLILHRNNHPLKAVIRDLREQGYAYQSAFYSTQEDPIVKAARIWESIRNGNSITGHDTKTLLSHLNKGTGAILTKLIAQIKDGIVPHGEHGPLLARPWHEVLSVSQDELEYLLAVRRRGESLIKVPRIRVSTIHGAKGGEAENVLLFSDISPRTYNAMESAPDAEQRVFYVALTRAKKRLFILEPQTKTSFNF